MDAAAPNFPGFAAALRVPLRPLVEAPPDGAKPGLLPASRGAASLTPRRGFRRPLQTGPQLAALCIAGGGATVGRLPWTGNPTARCVLGTSVRVRAAVWRAPRHRSVGPVARPVAAPAGCSRVPDVTPPAIVGSGVLTLHVDVVRTEAALITRGVPVRSMFAELIPNPDLPTDRYRSVGLTDRCSCRFAGFSVGLLSVGSLD